MANGLAARRAAVALLIEVTHKGRTLTEAMASEAADMQALEPQDRARAQRLALLTLRRIDGADALLQDHANREPAPPVLALLRLAVAELSERPKDAHGIVSEAVTLARQDTRTAQAAGFVNAILRKVSSRPVALTLQRMPEWLRIPLAKRYGKQVVRAIEAAHLAGPTLDLTLKDPSQAEAWAEKLGATLLQGGTLRLSQGGMVSGLEGYESGDWWVQDAAAAIPAQVLNAQKGERVLDMCAAPGGKTMQMAAAGAEVVAIDASEARMARLRENLERTGLKAETVVTDAMAYSSAQLFDAILLDAPCSATGTLRRHPDLPFVKGQSDVQTMVRLQGQMIDKALSLLKPGGRLVFCTCSLLPAEGEEQMAHALARHKDLQRDQKAVAGWPGTWDAVGGGLRIRPDHLADQGGMDGFFIAAFRKA